MDDGMRVVSELQESGIPVPKHIIVSREGVPDGEDPPGFAETEDYVAMNGAPKSTDE